MSNAYGSICDDFGLSAYLLGRVDLPTGRETALHFFEAVQKAVPTMTDFEKRSDGEYNLEEERDAGSYRWATLDGRRMCAGFVNPPALEDADEHNETLLKMAAYHLDLGRLQTEAVDVVAYFDFDFKGNHDEVVAEALAAGSAFEGLTQVAGARVLNFQPALQMALDDGCQLQARLNVETRTNAYQVRMGSFPESPISVYFTVRQFWGKASFPSFAESYRNQRRVQDELLQQFVIPNVIHPLARAIGAKQ